MVFDYKFLILYMVILFVVVVFVVSAALLSLFLLLQYCYGMDCAEGLKNSKVCN